MNILDVLRLVLYFTICDTAHWNWWAVISISIVELLWIWEYNSMIRELKAKYDKAAKRNSTTEKRDSQAGTREPDAAE